MVGVHIRTQGDEPRRKKEKTSEWRHRVMEKGK
jgi:hypothetical protein